MSTEAIPKYEEMNRLSVEDYVEVLRELDGDATTREIAEAAGRRQETVSRVIGRHFENGDDVEDIGGVQVSRVTRGATHVYEIQDDDAREAEDE